MMEVVKKQKLRVHFPGNNVDFDEIGLWIWRDVEYPSESAGVWPHAALRFLSIHTTDYGRFAEIELADDAQTVGLLINNNSGNNLSGDLYVKILSRKMKEVWLTSDFRLYYYQPLPHLRIHFNPDKGTNNTYWLNVKNEDNSVEKYQFGERNYVDIDHSPLNITVHLVIENPLTGWKSGELAIPPYNHSQLFIKNDCLCIYTNPYYIHGENIISAKVISNEKVEIHYTTPVDYKEYVVRANVKLMDSDGNIHPFYNVTQSSRYCLTLLGNFPLEEPLKLLHFGQMIGTLLDWKLKDKEYGYDGELGLTFYKDGTALLNVWSPSADRVAVRIYDKHNSDAVIQNCVHMEHTGHGIWSLHLNQENTGLNELTGYYYHLLIDREKKRLVALDPYAKSMAPWDHSDPNNFIGKAAIVNPSIIGPWLNYANIDGYEKREDAIIYEVHIRDFTSDPYIEKDLNGRFGTFSAFIDKLDYIKNLGVTHVQFMPVMSYFYCDETKSGERLVDYASTDQNYNWGYDPHSYFSISGMYSENPRDPAKRIKEMKQLIAEIHQRGMGVILDVVFNHTAKVRVLENLEPGYYHFMNKDGTTRRSFGGGRLGTTHKMARRLVLDSIKYWTEEFKVDGFRFDMMGDHDAETIQLAYEEAKELNPNVLMLGEGWRTYAGDETETGVVAADQDWMYITNSVACFSDEFRNELRSGYGCEGEHRFITNGARNIAGIFRNIMAKPGNFKTDDPGDVVQYIEAHDNLTLHDVIVYSMRKDPLHHAEEIHKRIRLGHVLLLTAQGTVFIHAGSEYGRTKQFLHPDFNQKVMEPPYKSTFVSDEKGDPIPYPYFIHDSYNASDSINKFDWVKVTDQEKYPIHTRTFAYIKGLIQLRRSTDAFHYGTMDEVEKYVQLLPIPEIEQQDVAIAYCILSFNQLEMYYVFVNADQIPRTFTLSEDLTMTEIITDGAAAGPTRIESPVGVTLTEEHIKIEPLTAIILRKNL
ncbi:pullulanase [Gracilibacillus xinjiangensis]|uniref:pullulanase n=1 Tax=Gracilibacillus xinjiangensis TaxID=1193282 RepID=A0ABV8WTW8_9BACI